MNETNEKNTRRLSTNNKSVNDSVLCNERSQNGQTQYRIADNGHGCKKKKQKACFDTKMCADKIQEVRHECGKQHAEHRNDQH